ncbi:MAG: type II/IV secretion system ATPase subunit [Erysipelothrix sp.]|nr:type II/IV secretion system ATPase subunit [Erysipelothrix sp.]
MNHDFDFEFLKEFISDEKITDVNYNGNTLWVDHLEKGRFKEAINISEVDLEKFCYKVANYSNKQFNNSYPILESETKDLRISIIHKSIAASGYSISIRKTPPVMRLNTELLLKQNYASLDLINFLKTLVEKRSNIIISGLPGVGKTELVKFLTSFIKANQRVITIEDSLEIRYSNIHPDKDGLMLKVNANLNYRQAIKACLRQRPDWLLLSEVRGDEVVELLQAVSTGANLISTIHADNAETIPQRILHMFPGNEITNDKLLYNIHESINYGVHIRSNISDEGISRYIDQVCKFFVKDSTYHTKTIYTHKKGLI